jgi:hypothetical protein
MPARFPLALLLFAAFLLVAGCDTSDPTPPADPAEVAGVYDFIEYRFNPDPQFVPDVVVLDTLILDRTSVELLDSGQFQLRYRLVGGLDNIINGMFVADDDEVVLSFEGGFEARLRTLLLNSTLRLSRTGADVLTLTTSKRVDLEAYSEEYRNTGLDLTDVRGLLEIELRRRGR